MSGPCWTLCERTGSKVTFKWGLSCTWYQKSSTILQLLVTVWLQFIWPFRPNSQQLNFEFLHLELLPSSWFALVLSALGDFKALLSFNLLQSQLYSQPPGPGVAHLTPQFFCFSASSITHSPRGTNPDQISAVQSVVLYFLVIFLLNLDHGPLSPLMDPNMTAAVVFQPC